HSKKEAHSLPLLLTVLAFLITGMVVINQSGVFLSFLYTLLFSIFIALRYSHNMRYLKKPVFWLQLLLVLLFSAMFYRGFSLEGIARLEGWIVGLKMIFRAGLLLSAFSAISTELKNPVIRNILYKQGMKNLYQSLELAFSALPGLIEAFSLKRLKVWNFHKLVQTMLFSSQWLLDEYVSRQKNKPEIFIICGEVNQGKTKTAKKVVDKLVSAGIKVSGFYTVANKDVEGEKTYFIEDISSGKKQKLGTKNIPLGDIKKSRFVFSERGLDFGKKILEHTLNVPPELIVIDEIGPLEIKGKGWAPEIEKLLLKSNTPQLWTVRQKLVDVAIRKWNVGEVHIFNMNSNMHEYLAARITRIINVTKVTSAGEVQ
ncbi:MAG: DUF2478 domain-containing protein, partial [Prolixibacteraceae bacterium]|nr:DUF2478 domain-containing protein [Prolixibacteraceae bacterium]